MHTRFTYTFKKSIEIAMGLLFLCLFLAFSRPVLANNVAVVVGISDYTHPDIPDLKFGDADAWLFTETLVKYLGYRREDIILLTSQPRKGEREATATNITKAIQELAGKQADSANSTFLFFASAHGVETKQGAMLAAKDFDPKQPHMGEQTKLTAQKLSQTLSNMNCGLVVAMLDICRKDGLIRADSSLRRDFVLPKGRAKRVATLFSSTEGPSFENDKEGEVDSGHGYFTFYLCRGLSVRRREEQAIPIVGALDEAANGVTLKSLHSYIRWNLIERTKNLPGATPLQPKVGSNQKNTESVTATSELSGQLPQLVCDEKVKFSPLAEYEKGKYRPEISFEDTYAVLRNKGLDSYEAKNYSDAALFFSHAFQAKEDGWTAFVTGLCFYQSGKLEEADKWYREAIKTDPKDASAMSNLGALLKAQGKLEKAEQWYRDAIKTNPKYALAMYNLAILLEEKGKLEEAEKWYREAIKTNPKYSDAMNRLGAFQYVQGMYQEAEKWWREAIKTNPKYALAMYNMGVLHYEQGKHQEAEKWWREAIKTNPEAATAMTGLGALLKAQGKFAEAEKWYRDAIKTDPTYTSAMNKLGVLLSEQGKLEEAEKWLHEAIKTDPKNAYAMYDLGVLRYKQGKHQEVEQWYREAIKTNPKYALAMYNLGNLLSEQGKLEEAEKWFREAIKTDPKYADAMFNLGILLSNQGRLEEAEKWYRDAIKSNPNYALAMSNLTVILEKHGKFEEAEKWSRAAIKIEPSNGLYHANLALVLFSTNRKEEAITSAKRAKELGLKNHPVYKRLGL